MITMCVMFAAVLGVARLPFESYLFWLSSFVFGALVLKLIGILSASLRASAVALEEIEDLKKSLLAKAATKAQTQGDSHE